MYEDLPLPAKLNTDMDKLAELQYEQPIKEHYTKMTHLPAQAISFSTPWYRLTNNLEKELVRHRRDTPGEEAALSNWEVDPTESNNVDWIAIEQAMKQWSKYQRGTPVKCIHELWDTTKRKKDWGQIKCGSCPLCGKEEEDSSHVLRCDHPLMRAARAHEISKLSRIVNSSNTSENLQRWIMVSVHQWIRLFPPSFPPKSEKFREIRNAIKCQQSLSIRNMFRGILSVKWRKAHETNLHKVYGENTSGISWATKISKAFLDFSIAMWKVRCQIIHANNVGNEEDFFRKKSLEICKNLQEDYMSLTQYERHLCKRTSKFFKRAPISTIKMWRKRIVSALKKNLEKEKVIGKNIKRFTKKNKQSRCRSDETRISLCKAVPSIRSFDSDSKMSSAHDKHRAISFNKDDMQKFQQKRKKRDDVEATQ